MKIWSAGAINPATLNPRTAVRGAGSLYVNEEHTAVVADEIESGKHLRERISVVRK